MKYFIQKIILDRKYYSSRIWSNSELKKFAPLFSGKVLNVSGWMDSDNEGSHYKNYFSQASDYQISNYKKEIKGLQGFENEFYLDLESDLSLDLLKKYDVVFNHTTLEHIYEFRKAFSNLCKLSKDIVIVIVPFLQQMHGTYGDYWRFSPLAIKKLFEENNFELLYLSFNNKKHHSVYNFAIGSSNPGKWEQIKTPFDFTCRKLFWDSHENFIGNRAIPNGLLYRAAYQLFFLIIKS